MAREIKGLGTISHPIGESYISLFEKLKYLNMINPIPQKEVEKMIQAKMIVVQNDDPPNVTQNQPPAPNDLHFIDMICDDKKACLYLTLVIIDMMKTFQSTI
ncbi:hypothetical protein RDI58_024302 [Solanum bulbocastanum]|uniref:Uncharacterized protein n=1 Tax=Solanum bulbocastanum TaxID=147425 RepID=A0AAN8SXZ1_SOLBU